MVAKPAIPIRSCNAGEFTPEAAGRVDIKQYYSAGLAFKNVEPVPQSGFRRMGGSHRMGEWRKPLAAQPITAPTLIAGPHVGTQTIWTGTVAGSIAVLIVHNLAISAGTATFSVEALVGGAWTTVAGPFSVVRTALATRTAAFAPGQQKAATGIRIRATFSESAVVSGLTVDAFFETGVAKPPRYVQLTTDDGYAISGFITEAMADFYTEDGFVGSASLGSVSASMLPDLDFYAEGNTIGVFHRAVETYRLFLMTPGKLHDWRSDRWPYDPVPNADLGGDYPKTDDVWEIFVRWAANVEMYMTVTVDGDTPPAVPHKDAAGAVLTSDNFTDASWAIFAADLQTALEGRPSIGPGVTVVNSVVEGKARKLTITFGGDLSGEQYDLSALITNTTDMSALPYHTQIGETETEPLFSAARGWPGTAALVQDRQAYGRIPAVPGAMAMSRVGEYFDLNTESPNDNAARLDKLRSQTSETILHIVEADYLFVFTDRGVYFVPNRTIERNTPLNFVLASEIGAQPNCKPFQLEGELYYVAINPKGLAYASEGGKQLFRVTESVTSSSTSFNGEPVSLLATHLVDKIVRDCRQRPESDLDASKGWLMRADGRLVATQMIRNQEINGYCEWVSAANGLVREIGVDGKNKLWLAIERAGRTSIELYDPAIYLQDAIDAVPNLAGVVSGLAYEDGAELWAVADGYVLGPFTVAGGSIDLEDAYTTALVGRWVAPRWEGMPQVLVTGDDQVIMRPGRIHTLHVRIAGTTSIAVGANGEAPVNIALNETGDPVDQPMPPKTMVKTIDGDDLSGFMEGTTAVITQLRPGELRVRDIGIGAKL